MATNIMDGKYLKELDRIEENVTKKYNRLITKLESKRDELLEQISKVRKQYTDEVKSREEGLNESNSLEKYFLNSKHNTLERFREKMKEDLMKEQATLRNVAKIHFRFQENLASIEKLISCSGEIIEEPYYERKVQSVFKIDPKKPMHSPAGITIHYSTEEIVYICDLNARRVHVFSIEGEHLKTIGESHLVRPYASAINRGYIFVTDQSSNAIFCFDISTNKFVCKAGKHGMGNGELDKPHGIACYENTVYVADSNNHRIATFQMKEKLTFLKNIELSKVDIKNPKDIKIREEELIVLISYQPFVYFFSLAGQYIRNLRGLDNFISDPRFFTFDSIGSLLIRDCSDDSIKIISKEGKLISSIQNEEPRRMFSNLGFDVSSNFKVIVAGQDRKCLLKVF